MTLDEKEQIKQQNTETVNEKSPTVSSLEAEQLFATFRVAETQTNIKIAKQQDIIDTLNAKIRQTETSQNRQNQTVAACQAVLESNVYPKLNSLISAFSESTQKSAEKKNNKIKSLKKKIKKAQKKMKRFERKQQRNKLLKGFISSLFDKNADKSAYVIGMQALKEDSLMRAEKKLDKVEQKLKKARAAFENGGLNHEDTLLLKSRIKKLEGLKTDLETKINNLTELDQSLNKLAKTEILENQFAEIQNVTRQNISGSTTISQAVDNMTNPEITTAVKKAVTGDVKKISESVVPVKEDKNNAEQKPTEEQKNPVPIEKADLRKRTGISEKECQAIVDAGVRIQVKKADDNTVTIVFHKNDTDTVNKAIESTKTQAMKR